MTANMARTAHIIRLLLVIGFIGMVILATFFLRKRRLSMLEYAVWGTITILLPVVGPFLVIWMQPGKKQSAESNLCDWLRH